MVNHSKKRLNVSILQRVKTTIKVKILILKSHAKLEVPTSQELNILISFKQARLLAGTATKSFY